MERTEQLQALDIVMQRLAALQEALAMLRHVLMANQK